MMSKLPARRPTPAVGKSYYAEARRSLALAVRIDEIKRVRDLAVAAAAYAKQARDSQLIANATEIRRRAEIKAGEKLIEMAKSGARAVRKNMKSQPATSRLADLGIDKTQSSRWQKLAALPKADQERVVTKARKMAVAAAEGDKAMIKEVRAEQQKKKVEHRAKREAELARKIKALPDERFGVIVADPPWDRSLYSRETGGDRHAENHYPIQSDAQIAALPVATIAASDCVLGLWCTDPYRGVDVLRAWGFKPKTYFVWIKDIVEIDVSIEHRKLLGIGGGRVLYETGSAGTGFWNRDRDEILLIGCLGKPVCPALGSQGESVWFAARGKHSEKPDCALDWFDKHFPNTPKIELNARRARANWKRWGLEAPEQEAAE